MTDLAQLFATDPLELTRDDISLIVEEMRKKRGQYNLGNARAGSMKPPTEKQKAALNLADKLGIDL